ncbi:MAG: NTP transferase domain-containing protein, partial [Krumholzibacteria bacterium]|nr:NTP transferase domain-containing protein [Candidatus Krumholzibacteria bacterium]
MTAAARPGPLDAVVLAAGLSRRAGTFKPAVEVAGRPLLGHAIAGLLPWCRQVVVVTGHEQGLVQGLVAGIAGAVTVHNPHYTGDMFLSVQAGAGALAADPAGFFVLPVDCPFVEPAVYRQHEESRRVRRQRPGAVTVHNPHYTGDMFLSVQAGAGDPGHEPLHEPLLVAG